MLYDTGTVTSKFGSSMMIVDKEITEMELNYLHQVENLFLRRHDSLESCSGFRITSVKRMKSAQQHVLLLSVGHTNINDPKRDKENVGCMINDEGAKLMKQLQSGGGKIILRIWSNGARWWNLNMKHILFQDDREIDKDQEQLILRDHLATAEVAGYRVAKKAIGYYNMKRKHDDKHQCCPSETTYSLLETKLCIPEVIYFNLEENPHCTSQPWALFSYVGEGSSHIESERNWTVCNAFINDMVKIRHEFGFDEPHPRHGRVNVKQALEYAFHVLDSVIIPIHFAFFDEFYSKNDRKKEQNDHFKSDLLQSDGRGLTWDGYLDSIRSIEGIPSDKEETRSCSYDDIVELHRKIIANLKSQVYCARGDGNHDKDDTKESDNHDIDSKYDILIDVISECIDTLQDESNNFSGIKEMPSVLCHIDLQPQNMILCKNNFQNDSDDDDSIPTIFSVLDWEESCYADPRLELLLLCRKVVANRYQADALWERYELIMREYFGEKIWQYRDCQRNESIIGSIEPWLKLETVHSVITMTIQGMNLGGRNPWEEKPDLFDKISRELERLRSFGWKFCNNFLDH